MVDIVSELSRLSDKELIELKGLLESLVWIPSAGPQTNAYKSQAQQILYGGAAGGGKSEWLLGMAATKHKRSLILRREERMLKGQGGLIERSREILRGTGARFHGSELWWRDVPGNRTIQFGGCRDLNDAEKYQGKPKTFLGLDEGAQFQERIVIYLMAWLRSVDGEDSQLAIASNPPMTADGEWIIDWWRPWVDKSYPTRALPGEVRWFARIGGKQIEVEGPGSYDGVTAISRTFFPALISDNPYLASDEGYRSRLENLPEPLRSAFLGGDFLAGRKEDAMQVIPNWAITAAQKRWHEMAISRGPQSSVGVDVAYGGDDETAIAPRHGAWFDRLTVVPGVQTPSGRDAAQYVISVVRGNPEVAVDMIGWGSACYEKCQEVYAGTGVVVRGINVGEKAVSEDGQPLTDSSGKYRFNNKRSWGWWALRDLATAPDSTFAIDPEDKLLEQELRAPRWELRGDKICVESKDKIKARIGRSTNRGDAVMMANMVGSMPVWEFAFA